MNKNLILLFTSLLAFSMLGFVTAVPNGANITEESSSSATAASPENHSAIAGNITELTIQGDSITQSWQGYFGNVSGAIELANSAGNVMYNWSLASPQGEVYASNASSITWAGIECFNWTSNGTVVEGSYNIAAGDEDGLNETFSDSNAHAAFNTGTTSFSDGDCMTAFIFDSTQSATDDNFEEVLLSDGKNTVFAALLEQDTLGFDNNPHDFEMLVLEDGHSGDSSAETYFFYIELE